MNFEPDYFLLSRREEGIALFLKDTSLESSHSLNIVRLHDGHCYIAPTPRQHLNKTIIRKRTEELEKDIAFCSIKSLK